MIDIPCCGCGYCCIKTPCAFGALRWGETAPCGGLEWDEEKQRFWCKLVRNAPDAIRPRLMEQMAMGAGCSSSLFNTHRDSFLLGKGKDYLIATYNWRFNF